MLRMLADENFSGPVVRGLLHRKPDIDLIRVQDVGLAQASDPGILDWAAREGRIVLTHDLSTMPFYAHQRIGAGLPMPGVFAVGAWLAYAKIIDDLELLDGASIEGEWEGQVLHFPV